jgi:hypothetical protein
MKKFDIYFNLFYISRHSGNEPRIADQKRFERKRHEGLGACRRRVFVAFYFDTRAKAWERGGSAVREYSTVHGGLKTTVIRQIPAI